MIIIASRDDDRGYDYLQRQKCTIEKDHVIQNLLSICLYDAALWNVYRANTLDKLNSAYNKCIKLFFLYNRRHSVTSML